jgi:hypothetical protein
MILFHPKKSLIFILSMINGLMSFGQMPLHESYIITYSNDTVYGIGDMNASQDYCVFKAYGADKRVKYTPLDIASYRYVKGDYFVSKQIPDSTGKVKYKFLEFLVDGEVDLYSLGSSGRFFMEMEGKDFLELVDNRKTMTYIDGQDFTLKDYKYIGYLRYYLKDAPELYPMIDKMEVLGQKNLVRIAVEYHNAVCDEYDCVDYTKPVYTPKEDKKSRKE